MGFIGDGERDFDYTRQYSLRSCLITTMIILTIIFACSTGMIVMVDTNCASKAQAWIPPYPNAQTVSQSHNFLRPFGMGITEMVMTSPDDPQTIQAWYNEDRRKRGVSAVGMGRYFTMDIEPTEEGSAIIYFGNCWSF